MSVSNNILDLTIMARVSLGNLLKYQQNHLILINMKIIDH